MTLDAQGDPNAVFIFRTASTLITGGSSQVSLINGAQACNVFWQVGSSATLGASSVFKGNILAMVSATLTTGANVEGRVLARTGAVTLDGNVVTKATCTPPPVPPPVVIAVVQQSSNPVPPIISLKKVPSPLALASGPGLVTYTYKVKNVGYIQMTNITLVDDKCTPNFVSGDLNDDLKLNVDEEWTYSCTANLSQTTKNTAIASGQANGLTAIDTAIATVVVGLSKIPPLINVVKKTTSLNMLFGGGPMTYTYTVTNPGTAPLSNVSIVDDKCTGLPGRVVGHPGDLNKNDLLESNESWTFTCQTNIGQTTTNRATAEGSANGLTAIDYAFATVVVASPALPSTGAGPNNSTLWNIAIPAVIFVSLLSLYLTRKKKTA